MTPQGEIMMWAVTALVVVICAFLIGAIFVGVWGWRKDAPEKKEEAERKEQSGFRQI